VELTTAQLSERTGVPAGTLRMWEVRHGFPRPMRLPRGHRRYSDEDVEQVRAVIRHRKEGLSLPAAILRAGARRRPGTMSIFAGLRERRPDLQPMALSKRALLALTRAIEDEHCARASSGVLIGSFQSARFYRQSQRRWRELARTARIAVALAEFDAPRQPAGAPYEVPVGHEHPLAREWAIVFDAPEASACLAGWEVPGVPTDSDWGRRFEVLWSPEPEVAHAAIAVAAELIAELAPAVGRCLEATLGELAEPTTPQLRAATALAHRMLAYLAGRLDSPD
jgi:MerR family transcriptional regulator, light-induced transcriptional regulator